MQKVVFPKDFLWGTATSSYQIEGAVREDGRGESIWDRFCDTPGKVFNGDSGAIADDHYHRYKEDIGLMKELGVNSYRFSVAWPRIYPEGKGDVNQKGLDFYNALVDELLKAGIEPFVTLYHWDLPQALQDIGGWENRDVIDRYVEYASTVFKVLGDRVKLWLTHNEPWVVSFVGNAEGRHAPGLKDFALAVNVSHHLLLSHARAVEVYRQMNLGGKIGITLNLTPAYAATDSKEDAEAAKIADGYMNRWFLDPVFKGSYPEDILKLYNEKLNAPVVKEGDMKTISGSKIDFLGINNYTRAVVKRTDNSSLLGYEGIKPEGLYTEMDWEVYPQGLYDLLTRVDRDYGSPEMYITENGAAFKDDKVVDGRIKDYDRLDYIKQHLIAANRAIQDGVKLRGYFVWSLMDNFEWDWGRSKKFGIIHVDYNTLERSFKESACWYREVVKNGGFSL